MKRPSPPGKVIVGMSGGVDSSVAALCLIEAGWTVEGLFMKNWEEDDALDYCSAAHDLADAEAVAKQLGIRLHRVNFATEYWERVFTEFLDEYRANRTPNPDVLCNREIKFGAFLDFAADLGADFIATGHYARLDYTDQGPRLLQAADRVKDQTYFLYMLGQHALHHSLFPLGEMTKPEVRRRAAAAGLPNHNKKDSTGICFIGERRFREFLQQFLLAQPGPIMNLKGEVIGHHQGLAYYTIGQRHGLGVGGICGSSEAPWFVAAKDRERNALTIVQGHDHPALLKDRLQLRQVHWTLNRAPTIPLACTARCRHRQPLQRCRATPLDDNRLDVEFENPQRAIAPGQSVVLYQGEVCVGGGVIE